MLFRSGGGRCGGLPSLEVVRGHRLAATKVLDLLKEDLRARHGLDGAVEGGGAGSGGFLEALNLQEMPSVRIA